MKVWNKLCSVLESVTAAGARRVHAVMPRQSRTGGWLGLGLSVLVLIALGVWVFTGPYQDTARADQAEFNAKWESYQCAVTARSQPFTRGSSQDVLRSVKLDCLGHPVPAGEVFETTMPYGASKRTSVLVWHSNEGAFFVSRSTDNPDQDSPALEGEAGSWVVLYVFACFIFLVWGSLVGYSAVSRHWRKTKVGVNWA